MVFSIFLTYLFDYAAFPAGKLTPGRSWFPGKQGLISSCKSGQACCSLWPWFFN